MHNLAKTVEGCLLPSSSAEVKWCLGIVVRQFKHCRAAIQRFGRVAINGAVETKGGKMSRRGLDRVATQIIDNYGHSLIKLHCALRSNLYFSDICLFLSCHLAYLLVCVP